MMAKARRIFQAAGWGVETIAHRVTRKSGEYRNPPNAGEKDGARLLDSQGLDRIDRCSPAGGDDTGEESARGERDDRDSEDQRIPTFYFVKLSGDQKGAADGDGDPDRESDEDLQECPAQDKPYHVPAVRA